MFVPKSVHLAILEAHEREREAWAKERSELLHRIQAPDKTETLIAPEPTGETLHVPLDDDDAWAHYEQEVAAGNVT